MRIFCEYRWLELANEFFEGLDSHQDSSMDALVEMVAEIKALPCVTFSSRLAYDVFIWMTTDPVEQSDVYEQLTDDLNAAFYGLRLCN